MIKIIKYESMAAEYAKRAVFHDESVTSAVREIIENVRSNGDAALYGYTEKFDGCRLSSLVVSENEIEESFERVDEDFKRILEVSAENIREFHRRQIRHSFIMTEREGVVLGQRVIPIENVGLYVPGGTAAYPSTVLMNAIPAKLAGCGNIAVATPPGSGGRVPDEIIAAARIAGADRIYKVGGAQAIAALAYGTETIKKVDKIVGPGNVYVAEAKRQVFGEVSIDMIAGPSEILIISDGNSNPVHVAADMLSQAEHDKNAAAILITDSEKLALAVATELERQLAELPRCEIARASIESNGMIIIAPTIERAIEAGNAVAPEHLELMVDEPFKYLEKIKNAGSVFLGRYTPEAVGDYYAGANHTLPTSGTARFSSPLSVDDFVKKSQYTYYSKEAFLREARDIAAFAEREGLSGHAKSAQVRIEGECGEICS